MDGAKAVAVDDVFVKTTWLPSRFSLAMVALNDELMIHCYSAM